MKRCPVCKSSNIALYMGGQFGKHQCKKCGYVGMIIEDRKAELDDKAKEIIKDMKKHYKKQ